MSRFTSLRAVVAVAALLVSTVSFAQNDAPLRVGADSGPYAEFLQEAARLARLQGMQVKVTEFTEPTHINEATNSGDIDLNNFQHVPYMQKQNEARGYKIVAIKPSYVAPAGIYSTRHKSLASLPQGAKIGIPNDPSNEARSLFLLQSAGLIKLKPNTTINAGLSDIADNPKQFKFIELDAGQIPRVLADLDLGVINLGRGALVGLYPKDALALEGKGSQWAIIWATRADKVNDPRIKRFIQIYESDDMKKFISAKTGNTIVPLW